MGLVFVGLCCLALFLEGCCRFWKERIREEVLWEQTAKTWGDCADQTGKVERALLRLEERLRCR